MNSGFNNHTHAPTKTNVKTKISGVIFRVAERNSGFFTSAHFVSFWYKGSNSWVKGYTTTLQTNYVFIEARACSLSSERLGVYLTCLLFDIRPTTFFSLLTELMLVNICLKSSLSNVSLVHLVLQQDNPDLILNDITTSQYSRKYNTRISLSKWILGKIPPV